jgi:NADH-quinone oxidoreductase subunit E
VLKSTRDREAEEAQAASALVAPEAAIAEAPVAPSKASKPKTDAIETNPVVKSPSPANVAPAVEMTASVAPPKHDAINANKAEPAVEAEDKQRAAPRSEAGPALAFQAPERLKGQPIGAAGQKPRKGRKEEVQRTLDDPDRPAGIERPANLDDLKLIAGIGPKIEETLHSLGIYSFAQIASWKKAEREWVDGYLNFKGRIERDDWVKQARALAKGGVIEYIRVFGKEPR